MFVILNENVSQVSTRASLQSGTNNVRLRNDETFMILKDFFYFFLLNLFGVFQ